MDDCNAAIISQQKGLCYFVTVNRELITLEADSIELPRTRLTTLLHDQEALNVSIKDANVQLAQFSVENTPVVESAIEKLEDDINLMEVSQFGGERDTTSSVPEVFAFYVMIRLRFLW